MAVTYYCGICDRVIQEGTNGGGSRRMDSCENCDLKYSQVELARIRLKQAEEFETMLREDYEWSLEFLERRRNELSAIIKKNRSLTLAHTSQVLQRKRPKRKTRPKLRVVEGKVG